MPLRGRFHLGPALRRLRLPVKSTVVSVVFHAAFVGAVLWGNAVWGGSQAKPVIVNLVPAVAAVGAPQGRPEMPPRAAEPPPPQPTPTELPRREASRDLPARDLPARDLPARDLPTSLPEPGAPPRAPGLPRPSDKELPTVASPRTPAPTPAPAPAPAAPQVPPLGQRTGSPQGVGALTLNVTDFPYAWYIAAVHRKIKERWDGYALAGHQPAVIFEIARNGELTRVVVDKTSGNPYYDQAAVRAVTEANPFPPLPVDFKKPTLTVGLQFAYDPTATR
jgi:TonB family protein